MASKAPHGTRTAYVRGCRCEKCTTANSEYSTKKRLERRGVAVDGSPSLAAVRGRGRPRLVTAEVDDDYLDEPGGEYVPGRCEAAIEVELRSLSATQKQPGLAEGIRQMARLLDSPKLASTHTSAMARMQDALKELRAASAGRSGRLASVASMSRREDSRASTG